MQINKIINNNIISSRHENGLEVILMGKGIGFGKKSGDYIDQNCIEKTFTLESLEEANHFEHILKDIPSENFAFVDEIITDCKIKLGKKFSSFIYITLADHILTLEERAATNSYIKNTMLWDIKRLYKDEFKVGLWVIEQVNKKINAHFDENEAATIAMHFVNAQIETDASTVINITKVITDILSLVTYHFNIVLDDESLSYYRFITHLRFFSQRLFIEEMHTDGVDQELFDLIKQRYPEYYQFTAIINNFLKNTYNYEITDEEAFYLTIHVSKLVSENKEKKA